MTIVRHLSEGDDDMRYKKKEKEVDEIIEEIDALIDEINAMLDDEYFEISEMPEVAVEA